MFFDSNVNILSSILIAFEKREGIVFRASNIKITVKLDILLYIITYQTLNGH